MTAQIFNFPSQPTTEPAPAEPVASDYAEVARRLTESAGIRGYDLRRLARAIMAAVDRQERETQDALFAKMRATPCNCGGIGCWECEPGKPCDCDRTECSECYPAPTPQPEYRVVDKFRGAKYQSGRDVVVIAKLLRKDIAEARNTTLVMLPAHATVSVTTSRYSMGCSITVRIKGLTIPEKWTSSRNRTELCKNIKVACTELMNAYKRDNSDTMTDYYDVNFSGYVVVD